MENGEKSAKPNVSKYKPVRQLTQHFEELGKKEKFEKTPRPDPQPVRLRRQPPVGPKPLVPIAVLNPEDRRSIITSSQIDVEDDFVKEKIKISEEENRESLLKPEDTNEKTDKAQELENETDKCQKDVIGLTHGNSDEQKVENQLNQPVPLPRKETFRKPVPVPRNVANPPLKRTLTYRMKVKAQEIENPECNEVNDKNKCTDNQSNANEVNSTSNVSFSVETTCRSDPEFSNHNDEKNRKEATISFEEKNEELEKHDIENISNTTRSFIYRVKGREEQTGITELEIQKSEDIKDQTDSESSKEITAFPHQNVGDELVMEVKKEIFHTTADLGQMEKDSQDMKTQDEINKMVDEDESLILSPKIVNEDSKRLQQTMLANIGVALIENGEVENFQLSTDEDNYILLKVELKGQIQNYAIQIKYTTQNLFTYNKHRDISLSKHFTHYNALREEDFKIVLCTNRKLEQIKNLSFKVGSDELSLDLVRIESEVPSLLFNTIKSEVCFTYKYRIVNSDDLENLEDYREFLENFILVTDAPSSDNFNAKLFSFFSSNTESLKGYFNFIQRWSSEESTRLDKNLVKNIVALNLASPFVKILPHSAINLQVVNEKFDLLREAISNFKVTILESETNDEILSELFKNYKGSNLDSVFNSYQHVFRREVIEIRDLNNEEYMKLVCLAGSCPVVVEDNENVRKAILLCPNFSFIIFGKHIEIPGAFKTLANLKEINENVFQKVVNQFVGDLQGKELSLITVTQLLGMMEGSVKDDLPSYIPRSLSRPLISVDFVRNTNDDTLILLSCFRDDNLIRNYLRDFEIINMEDLPSLGSSINKKIYISRDECSQDQFNRVCSIVPKKNFHQLKVVDQSKLEWIRSKSFNIHKLREYLLNGSYVPESEILSYESENRINIICAESGMGKTWLMRSMEKEKENLWSVLICVKDHVRHFKDNVYSDTEKFKEYIFERMHKDLTQADFKIFNTFWKKGFVRFLWDGLDELCNEYFIVVKNIINKLDYKQWVTSRINLRDELENDFQVVAKTIKKFDKTDQKTYIEKRLNGEGNLSKLLEKDFLQIPLNLFILTEVMIDPRNSLSIDTLPDLYRHFVISKIERTSRINLTHQKIFNNFAKLAVRKYFVNILSAEERLDSNKFLKQLQDNNYPFEVITQVTEDFEAEFRHISFQDYFSVVYLIENMEKISPDDLHIFGNENLRYYFDIMVSEGCKAHQAVLSKDFNLLKTCSDEELNKRDKAGRTALHLACFYCTKFAVVNDDKIGSTHIIDDRLLYWKELTPDLPILHFLFEKCDRSVKDYFDQDCLAYDYDTKSWPLISLRSYNEELDDLDSQVVSILYYSLRFDYADIFEKIGKLPFIKSKHFDKSFLYLAVHYNAVNCLEKILANPDNPFYKEIVKNGSEKLMSEAYKKQNTKILQILIANGAQLEMENSIREDNYNLNTSAPTTYKSLNIL